jgi:hypothetical protein
MSVWLDKTGRHPDNGHRLSGQTTLLPKFQKFRWKSFLFKSRVRTVRHCRSDGRMSATSNFHIEAPCVQTRRMGVWMVNLMHAISISDARASGRESTSSGWLQQSSHICVWKEILKLDWTLRVVQTGCLCLDVCKLEQFEASRHRAPDGNPRRLEGWCFSLMCVRTVCHVIRTVDTLDSWASGRYDTSSGRLAGNRIFWLANCAESSRTLLNSGIPDKKHFCKEVILSNKMWPITN